MNNEKIKKLFPRILLLIAVTFIPEVLTIFFKVEDWGVWFLVIQYAVFLPSVIFIYTLIKQGLSNEESR